MIIARLQRGEKVTKRLAVGLGQSQIADVGADRGVELVDQDRNFLVVFFAKTLYQFF
jgi:hypothetical protein